MASADILVPDEFSQQDDTQEVPTQERESFSKSARMDSRESVDMDEHEPEHDPQTYETGEAGHIKLIGEDSQMEGTLGYAGNDESQNTFGGLTQGLVTSPLMPMPESLAGNKRDYNGDFINHAASPLPRTPRPDLASIFAGFPAATPGITLHGLFNGTQADGTPGARIPQEDVVFERPSPDFRVADSSSQPQAQRVLLSPTKEYHNIPRATTEPKDTYISVRQSQDIRLRKQSEGARSSADIEEELDDDFGDDIAQRRVNRKLQKVKVEQEAAKQFAILARVTGRDTGRGRSEGDAIDLTTPATLRPKARPIVISDDIRADEEDLAGQGFSSDDESVDEYDELSQAVLRSDHLDENTLGPAPDKLRKSNPRISSTPMRRSLLQNHASSQARRTFPSSTQQSLTRYSQKQPRVAVANSQPESLQYDSMLARTLRTLQPSSITSQGFISESQSVGLTLSSGRGDLTGLTLPQESIVSSIPMPPPLPVLSSQTSRTSKDGEEEIVREDSPASSPPPELPQSSKELIANGATSRHQTGSPRSMSPGESADELDHLTRKTPAPVLHDDVNVRESVEEDMEDAAAAAHARLSNRKRHQIPDSSPIKSSAGDTRLAPREHGPQETTKRPDNEYDDSHATSASSKQNTNATLSKSNSGSTYDTAPTHQSRQVEQVDVNTEPQPAEPQPERVFKMSEIAMQPSQEDSSAAFDTSHINIMDEDDMEFEAMLSGRSGARKPPRTTYARGTNIQKSAQRDDRSSGLSSPPQTSPVPRKSVRLSAHDIPETPKTATVQLRSALKPSTGKLKRINIRALNHAAALSTPVHSSERPAARSEIAETPQSDPLAINNAASESDLPTIHHEREDVTEDSLQQEAKVNQQLIHERDSAPAEPAEPAEDVEIESVLPALNVDSLVVPHPSTPMLAQEQKVSDRVFARFNGQPMAFYPATCLGPATLGSSTQRVRFDDGTVTELEAQNIRRFELFPGDKIRINLPDLRQNAWTVVGFLNPTADVHTQSTNNMLTDIRGFKTVRVESKKRKSLPVDGLSEMQVIDVALQDVYLTLQQWNQLKGRAYKHVDAVVPAASLHTPFNLITAPATPSSRTRRKTIGDKLPPSRTISLASEAQSSIFNKMAFAITYPGDKDSYRNRVSRLILSNGGSILSEGFDELFESTVNTPTTSLESPSSRSPANASPKLILTSGAKKLGFTALIADAHCRKAKYMQALALNIPCLSGRWIVDCIAQERLLPWEPYLLPAGESTFLHGAVRSRTFTVSQAGANDPTSAKLSNMIEQRAKLANNKHIILVAGSGKQAEEKRRLYLFLMCALGAGEIEIVKDTQAAKVLLKQPRTWDWVYVDDAKVGKAADRLGLTGGGAHTNARKRKRGVGDLQQGTPDELDDARAKVINDEFVVQSLILGALVENT